MIYSDTTNKNGIIQNYERYTDLGIGTVSGDTELLRTATAYANQVGKEIYCIIYRSAGNWQYDDSNTTTLPFATTDLVIGQRRYTLPVDSLDVIRVEVKDKDGNWAVLSQRPLNTIEDGIDDYMDDNGNPSYYRLVGNVIELYAPSIDNVSAGLKVFFDRSSVDFAYNDTTKTPGFASQFHDLISMGSALKWMKIKNPTNQSLLLLKADYDTMLLELKSFYNNRNKDYKPRISRAYQNFK